MPSEGSLLPLFYLRKPRRVSRNMPGGQWNEGWKGKTSSYSEDVYTQASTFRKCSESEREYPLVV